MKKIIKIFITIFAVLSVGNSILGQSDITKVRTGYKEARVKKQIYPDNTYDYYSETSIDYGTYENSSGTSVLYRAMWYFILPTDIPQGYHPHSVVLKYNGNSYDSFILGYVSNFQSGLDYEGEWNLADNAEYLGSYIGANGTILSTGPIPNLPDKIDNAHQTGKSRIYLSVKSGTDFMNTDLVTLTNITLEITYKPIVTLIADNNFIDNSGAGTRGTMKIDETTRTIPSNGYEISKTIGENLTLEAVSPQTSNDNYQMKWHTGTTNQSDWTRNGAFRSYDQTYPFTVTADDDGKRYKANLRKVCNISFSNQFSGTTMGGKIYIDGEWVNAPTAETVVEQNPIVFMAENYYDENNIRYIFDKWNDNNTSKSRTIYPSSHKQYTAIYKGYPIFEYQMRGLVISGVREGKEYYIKLEWNEHPNSYVTQYHIYRYTKHNGVTTSPVKIATKSYGNTTFTDRSFTYAPSNGDYFIYYDVKAYFSPDGTTSPNNFEMVRGDEVFNQVEKEGSDSEELIKEYAVSNYPNPFNPTTTIRYQLPKAGHVQIKVYDAIGKEVSTLVNEHLESGRYEVRFGENDLPSGMYIYTIKVNDYFASKKMLLIK